MRYFNEDGFLFVFVIFITSILLLIGLTTLILTQDDYEMKRINSSSKKNFYIAEAVLEEVDTLIYEHIEEAIDFSYENLIELENLDNTQFKVLYKSYMNSLEGKLEDLNSYKLKTDDNLEFSVEVGSLYEENLFNNSEEQTREENIEGFLLTVLAICDKEGIRECIEVEYQIETAKYMSYENTKSLVTKKSWVNSQW